MKVRRSRRLETFAFHSPAGHRGVTGAGLKGRARPQGMRPNLETFMLKTFVFASALAALACMPAHAADAYRFEANASDFSTTSGVERTMNRIDRFASAHCGVRDRKTLPQQAEAKRCKADVVAEIVAKIGDPALSAALGETGLLASR
jgi:UrcA family protein